MNLEPAELQKFTENVAKEIKGYESMKAVEVELPHELQSEEQKRREEKLWEFFLHPPPGVNFQQPLQQLGPVITIGGGRKKKRTFKGKNPPSAEQLVEADQAFQAAQANRAAPATEQLDGINQAIQAARRSPLRRAICAVLTTGTKDAFDIAKLLTPILLPLSLAGTIAIPAAPVAYAALCIVIARMGVATFCSIPKDDKD